jgi:hypothetical protein
VAKCAIPECENNTPPRSKLPVCPTCRGNIGSWKRRRPAEVLERRRKLHMYDNRMDIVVKDRKIK